MSNLSHSAQSVLDAYWQTPLEAGVHRPLAAALRAAVTQVTPVSTNARQMKIRDELLAIADELEGIKYGTYRCDLEDKPQ
jgi:hypothetical protein